ncbi:isoleucine--tRNA ligase [Candidatus Riesia pediculicola]|uniref:isoleucine--tRNA ligase n=1 Tax=Candidatus Riesia pediculicola TaxID=401619 RepID=UPI00178CCE70|nr:isoleucine--tRNA ligase [Candidatus Riesia pediculicola]QOJ86613.1 isoleucine--tRNA ligase [Candidatus Riesia pediculicola]
MKNYKDTINLPRTKFSMYGNLKERELEFLEEWNKNKMYHHVRNSRRGKKTFVLHDGPPYANGNVHIGHAVNKILKDILIKSKRMKGFDSPFILGWDCHGLPIENQIEKIKGKLFNKNHFFEFRKECRNYAYRQIKKQKIDFKRMGILADWNRSYLTMQPNLESNSIRILGKIIENDHLIRKRKPVYWCTFCQSALAEAEVEYYQKYSLSIYVAFKSINFYEVYKRFRIDSHNLPVYAVIWTTNPWTLPANQAISVNRNFLYQLVELKDCVFIVSEKLLQSFVRAMKIKRWNILSSCYGSELEFLMFSHPFINFNVPIVLSDFVHLCDGTGLVHISPGHGLEDYDIGVQYNLGIKNVVDSEGKFLKGTNPILDNVSIFESDGLITRILKQKKRLLSSQTISHNYPFCWRHKVPLIFRSTTQWFVSMEKNCLRERILDRLNDITWYPKWGRDRMEEMIQNHPDWCISRQRSWGTPIPLFIHKKNQEMHPNTLEFISDISKKVEIFGSEYWWNINIREFLSEKDEKEYFKEKDILDVWFDSGSISYSVVDNDLKDHLPDIYLEGFDQYRGWFMSSLILSVAVKNNIPCKTIIAHGFVVDEHGRKMSKSVGNIITPKEIIDEFGADVLRLWVASSNYRKEINISEKIIAGTIDHYRKIRNTMRFLLSNINDFDIRTDEIDFLDMVALDQRMLIIAKYFQEKIIVYYEDYKFHKVIESVLTFCSIELSSEYFSLVKDRQYMDLRDSISRRSCQTTFFHILSALIRWISPILSFTSYEIWKFLFKNSENNLFSENYYTYLNEIPKDGIISMDNWNLIFLIKKEVNRIIEKKRKEKKINHSLESNVVLYANSKIKGILKLINKELKFLFLTSEVRIENIKKKDIEKKIKNWETDLNGLKIIVSKSKGRKCDRCWHYFNDSQEEDEKIGDISKLCRRCILNLNGKMEIRKFI